MLVWWKEEGGKAPCWYPQSLSGNSCPCKHRITKRAVFVFGLLYTEEICQQQHRDTEDCTLCEGDKNISLWLLQVMFLSLEWSEEARCRRLSTCLAINTRSWPIYPADHNFSGVTYYKHAPKNETSFKVTLLKCIWIWVCKVECWDYNMFACSNMHGLIHETTTHGIVCNLILASDPSIECRSASNQCMAVPSASDLVDTVFFLHICAYICTSI